MKIHKRAFILALAVFASAAVAVLAASPNVRSGTAVVDGNPHEWQITPTNSSNLDWFVQMQEGNSGNGTTVSDVFARVKCNGVHTATLFVLVYQRSSSFPITQDGEAFIALNGSPGNKQTLTGPDYVIQGGATVGWEASFVFDPSTTTSIAVHDDFNGGNSAWTPGKFDPISVTCTASAVTLSSMSAKTVDGGVNLAVVVLGGLGIVALGGLMAFAIKKR